MAGQALRPITTTLKWNTDIEAAPAGPKMLVLFDTGRLSVMYKVTSECTGLSDWCWADDKGYGSMTIGIGIVAWALLPNSKQTKKLTAKLHYRIAEISNQRILKLIAKGWSK